MIKLFDTGIGMVRVNLSHGGIKANIKLLKKYLQAKRLRPQKTIALMLELRGREIRISHIGDASGTMRIRSGSIVEMIGGAYHQPSSASSFKINCESIQRYLKPNDVVYFDDGKVVGIVIEISGNGCKMEIKLGGTIQSKC